MWRRASHRCQSCGPSPNAVQTWCGQHAGGHAGVVRNGGAEGARTPDLRRARAALSQLSYGPSDLEQGVRADQPCATIQPTINPETAREAWDEALGAWLNSSLGMLTLLARRTSTRAGWVSIKKADLTRMPVLDARALSAAHVDGIPTLFDELSDSKFQRLAEMVDCPKGSALDDGLSEILGLPELIGLRRLLTSEPAVSNQRL